MTTIRVAEKGRHFQGNELLACFRSFQSQDADSFAKEMESLAVVNGPPTIIHEWISAAVIRY